MFLYCEFVFVKEVLICIDGISFYYRKESRVICGNNVYFFLIRICFFRLLNEIEFIGRNIYRKREFDLRKLFY